MNFGFKIRPGDLIKPADGSDYIGIVIYVSKDKDMIVHRCLNSWQEYTKPYFGFFCRYNLV